MVLEVTYTYEDYAEANRAHMAAGSTRKRSRAGVAGWIMFIVLAVVLFLLLSKSAVRVPPPVAAPGPGGFAAPIRPPPSASLVSVILPLIPWLLIFAFIWFFVFRLLRAAKKTPQSSLFAPGSGRPDPSLPIASGAAARSALTWVFAITLVIAALVLMVLYSVSDETGTSRSGGMQLLLGLLPYVLILIVLVSLFRHGGLGVKRVWEGQPHLHRPKRIEIAEPGVVVSDGVSRLEELWPAFTHVRETKNLFLLYLSHYSFQMIPKRAFASAAEADAFRELVRRMVVERPGPAFPVLPAAPPPLAVEARQVGQR